MCFENVDEALKRWPGLAVNCEVEIVEWNGASAPESSMIVCPQAG